MTWELATNDQILDASNVIRSKRQVWWYYQFLSKTWTVLSSNKWSSAESLVCGSRGSLHSWVALKSPDALGPIYLVLAYDLAVYERVSWWFSSALPSGGDANNTPTLSGGAYISTFNDAYTAGYNLHGASTEDGSFVLTLGRNSSPVCNSFISVNPIADAVVIQYALLQAPEPEVKIVRVTNSTGTVPPEAPRAVVEAAYFRMRALDGNAGTTTYRYWTVEGAPDTDGAQYSGDYEGSSPNLLDISVVETFTRHRAV